MSIPEEQWMYGPDLDVYCYFREPVMKTWNADTKAAILSALAIGEIEDVGWSNSQIDGIGLPLSRGLWQLAGGAVGVKIIPDIRESGHELLLAIPPNEAKRRLGDEVYMFRRKPGVRPFVQIHADLIERCRALHAVRALRAALIQVEDWLWSLPEGADGICVHPGVAEAAGLQGRRQDEMYVIPW